ncbi:MAG: hypothetical protein ABR521_00950, partial [Gaiellaceae bacterium]
MLTGEGRNGRVRACSSSRTSRLTASHLFGGGHRPPTEGFCSAHPRRTGAQSQLELFQEEPFQLDEFQLELFHDDEFQEELFQEDEFQLEEFQLELFQLDEFQEEEFHELEFQLEATVVPVRQSEPGAQTSAGTPWLARPGVIVVITRSMARLGVAESSTA